MLELVEGRLPRRRAARVEGHTQVCMACGQLLAALRAIWPRRGATRQDLPARIGAYRVRTQLRNAALGPVYGAVDPQSGRRVAIKLIAPGSATHLDIAELKALGRRLAQVPGPSAVPILDAGHHEDRTYVVMTQVGGIALREYIEDEQPSWRRTAELFARLARALLRVHEHGLVHGDLNVDNILIDRAGRIRIADFGLDTSTAAHNARFGPRNSAGTEYRTCRAPEQYGGIHTSHSDQFAFGALLYRALYNCAPYPGETLGDMLMHSIDGGLQEPSRRPGGGAIWSLVVRCLSVDPRDRWDDMGSVAAILEERCSGPLRWLERRFSPGDPLADRVA